MADPVAIGRALCSKVPVVAGMLANLPNLDVRSLSVSADAWTEDGGTVAVQVASDARDQVDALAAAFGLDRPRHTGRPGERGTYGSTGPWRGIRVDVFTGAVVVPDQQLVIADGE